MGLLARQLPQHAPALVLEVEHVPQSSQERGLALGPEPDPVSVRVRQRCHRLVQALVLGLLVEQARVCPDWAVEPPDHGCRVREQELAIARRIVHRPWRRDRAV